MEGLALLLLPVQVLPLIGTLQQLLGLWKSYGPGRAGMDHKTIRQQGSAEDKMIVAVPVVAVAEAEEGKEQQQWELRTAAAEVARGPESGPGQGHIGQDRAGGRIYSAAAEAAAAATAAGCCTGHCCCC